MVTLVWLLINLLAMVSTGWKTASSAIPAEPAHACQLCSLSLLALPQLALAASYRHRGCAQRSTPS